MKKRPVSEAEKVLFRKTVEQAAPLLLKPGPRKAAAKAKSGSGGLDGNTRKKLRQGALCPSARLDLHGLTQAAAHRSLLFFLPNARKNHIKLALVITGASGVLKQMVPRWLNQPEFAALITGIEPAHVRHGGAGALYVYLRK
jgi:DNA-nicking Smr family endonuclease